MRLPRRYAQGAERILDAGCGTGYGSKFLSHNAGSVVGIDASVDAIDYAARQYAGATTRFLVGPLRRLCPCPPRLSI